MNLSEQRDIFKQLLRNRVNKANIDGGKTEEKGKGESQGTIPAGENL